MQIQHVHLSTHTCIYTYILHIHMKIYIHIHICKNSDKEKSLINSSAVPLQKLNIHI